MAMHEGLPYCWRAQGREVAGGVDPRGMSCAPGVLSWARRVCVHGTSLPHDNKMCHPRTGQFLQPKAAHMLCEGLYYGMPSAVLTLLDRGQRSHNTAVLPDELVLHVVLFMTITSIVNFRLI